VVSLVVDSSVLCLIGDIGYWFGGDIPSVTPGMTTMSGVINTVLLVLYSNTQMRISGYLGSITTTLTINSRTTVLVDT
jgi:hypothetical protein